MWERGEDEGWERKGMRTRVWERGEGEVWERRGRRERRGLWSQKCGSEVFGDAGMREEEGK